MIDLAHYAVFERRPDDTYIQQWKEHIKQTGSPETFDYVTMVGPSNVDRAVILSGDIEVPLDKREDEGMVPCPLCRPRSPKFKTGRMVWFPIDRTVLFIGNKCARRHMGSEYEIADKRFKKEAGARLLSDTLAAIQERAPELIVFARKMLPIAAALEKTKKEFHADAPKFLSFMKSEFAFQEGKIQTTVNTGLKNQHGRLVYETRQIGTLVGGEFLVEYNAHQSIKSAISTLEAVQQPLPAWSVDDVSTHRIDEVLRIGNKAAKAVHALKDARDYLQGARQFVHENNLNLFNRWAALDGSPFESLNIRKTGSWLFLDVSAFFASEKAGFQIPAELFNALPNLGAAKFDLPQFPFISRLPQVTDAQRFLRTKDR